MRPTHTKDSLARALAIAAALGSSSLAGCYASHVREADVTLGDGGVAPRDAGARDAATVAPDAGPGRRDAGARDAAVPDAGPTLHALFVPECAPDDGPALRVFASDTPIACEDLDSLGPHVELYLWSPPDPTATSTVYEWGTTIANATFARCTGPGEPCEVSTSGNAHADLYVSESRLVVEWTANFSSSPPDMRRVDARFCPRSRFCG